MDLTALIRLGSGLAVTIGLALLILWRIADSPIEILVTGLVLVGGGIYCVLLNLGVITPGRRRSGGSLDLDCNGGCDSGD